MGVQIEISDELLCDAILAAQQSNRSVAKQIEYWAQLGKSVELYILANDKPNQTDRKSLAEIIASIDTPEGKQRVRDCLATLPFPHFEDAIDAPGYLVQIEADGTSTVGRFVDRVFVAKRD